MKRRLISILLTACAVVSLLALPAWAAGTVPSQEEAAQVVRALGIMAGDEQGSLNLSSPVTRAEFITMAVKAMPGGGEIGQAATSPYPDVPRSHWASGYVEAGVKAGLVSGFSDGTFRPNHRITLAEGATIVLQLLGYGPEDLTGAYPAGQLAMYHSLGLDRGVTASQAGTELKRLDAMYLFYNLMTAKNKEGQVYLTTLGYALNEGGEIDLVALMGASMEGPVVAQGDWRDSLPLTLSSAAVYRDGKPASADAVQEYDVLYYNRSMATLWAYSDKVTGTLQTLEPSAASPTSVTVAGRTCTIETASAAYALSNLGQYRPGDTVTLLLGRTGGVAAVVEGGAAWNSGQVGVVTAVENASHPDGAGGSYTSQTITLLATDGQSYRYPYALTGLKAGALVQVTASGTEGVTLRRLNSASLSGTVNAAGTKVGSYSLAKNVEILDVSGSYGLRVYPQRLAGVNLTESMVEYYSLNGSGEIDKLILNDVTGDMHHYGILEEIQETPVNDFTSYYSYVLNVEGNQVVMPDSTTRYSVEEGPVCVRGSISAPERLVSLTLAGKGGLVNGAFVVNRTHYTISEQVVVYEYRNGGYYLSSLARVQEGGYELTGWYDKAENAGGRLRVIIAR